MNDIDSPKLGVAPPQLPSCGGKLPPLPSPPPPFRCPWLLHNGRVLQSHPAVANKNMCNVTAFLRHNDKTTRHTCYCPCLCLEKKIHQTWSAAMLPSGIVTPQNQFVDLSPSISPALTFIHPCTHREINTMPQLRTSTDVDLYPRLTHLLHLDLISSGQLLAVHDDVELLVCQVEPALVTVGLLLPDGDPRGVIDVHTWNGMKRSWTLNLWLLCEVMIVTSVYRSEMAKTLCEVHYDKKECYNH